jgi:hypothetical protein
VVKLLLKVNYKSCNLSPHIFMAAKNNKIKYDLDTPSSQADHLPGQTTRTNMGAIQTSELSIDDCGQEV